MTSLELLKEIEAWLCFNTEPSKEETAKLRKSINEHVSEQLRLDAVEQSFYCDERDKWGKTECGQQCMACCRDENALQ